MIPKQSKLIIIGMVGLILCACENNPGPGPGIHDTKYQSIGADGNPVTGEIGELGFGTQVLPVSGRDIQDEKILGTIHLATGRSDHLGGSLTPDRFAEHMNATHDDILFAPFKTPEIDIPEVRMRRDGATAVVLSNYRPAPYLLTLLDD